MRTTKPTKKVATEAIAEKTKSVHESNINKLSITKSKNELKSSIIKNDIQNDINQENIKMGRVVKESSKEIRDWNSLPKDFQDIVKFCNNNKESDFAYDHIILYLSQYTINDISDIGILKSIIFNEIIIARLYDQINDQQKKSKDLQNKYAFDPIKNISELIFKFNTETLVLKNSLGLIKSKKDKVEGADQFVLLTNKMKTFLNENQASRLFYCGDCGKPQMLRVVPEKWEERAQSHPFFKDKILGNEALIKFYIIGHDTECPNCSHVYKTRLTSTDVGQILETSADYTDWLISKWGLNREMIIAKYNNDEKIYSKNIKKEVEPIKSEETVIDPTENLLDTISYNKSFEEQENG